MRDTLQRTMQAHAAVFRNSESLTQGVDKMKKLWGGLGDMQHLCRPRETARKGHLMKGTKLDVAHGTPRKTYDYIENNDFTNGRGHEKPPLTRRRAS